MNAPDTALDVLKIVGYLALLGTISWAWVEVASRTHSEITHKIRREVRGVVAAGIG